MITSVILIAALLGLALLGANLYVQAPGSQQQIRQRLSAVLGLPVELARAVYSPWGGLRIDGIRAIGPDQRPVLQAESLVLGISGWDLLRGRFTITSLTLEAPDVLMAQDAEGRWLWQKMRKKDAVAPPPPAEVQPAPPVMAAGPTPAPAEAAPSVTPSTTPPTVAKTSPTPPAAPAAPAARGADLRMLTFPPGFERVRLVRANLTFLSARGRRVAVLEEVELDLRPLEGAGPTDFTGRIAFARAGFDEDKVRLTEYSSSVKFLNGVVYMPDGAGNVAEGRIESKLTVRPTDPGSPYELEARLSDVSLGQLVGDAGGDPDFATGRLEGTLHLTGLGSDSESRSGGGRLRLLDGQFRRSGLLKTLGDRSKIEELRKPEFQLATLDYKVQGLRVTVEPLELASANLRLQATGDCRFPEGGLDLQARLTLSPSIARQVPGILSGQFADSPETPGEKYIDFKVGGTLSQPNTDLFERTLSAPVKTVISRIFGSRKKKEEAEPEPTPSATPSPRS
ncbi:MAG: hypothetical protein JSR82_16905 [Verrucomicrobia bacterium]|nr:hypothetical protein [Verrucomicrobiota bacterium]